MNVDLNLLPDYPNKPLEHLLGKCLMQPHSNMNSASRKLMLSPQLDQKLPIYDSEVAISSTGYENKFGENNSSYLTSDRDYVIIGKVSKFHNVPDQRYILIVKDINTNYFHIIEREHCNYNTESYGYLYNNTYMDSKKIGEQIYIDDTIRKSTGYDNFDNRQDGLNAKTAYMSLGLDTDDGIIISRSFQKKLDAPLIKKVQVVVNENNISLNIYGDDNKYESFPNINYKIENGILYASRVEKKDECLFSQSYDRLRKVFMSDNKYTLIGKVVDITMYCNNPDKLYENYYNTQLLDYYKDSMRYSKEIFDILHPIISNPDASYSYELSSLYLLHSQILKNKKWVKENQFNFCIIEFIIEERNVTSEGDKIANRYGGKGVIAGIWEDEQMPLLETGERVEVIIDSNSVVARTNTGQLFELSSTFIGSRIIELMKSGAYDTEDKFSMYLQYLSIVAPTQCMFIANTFKHRDTRELSIYMDSILESEHIYTVAEPISESLNLDKLDQLYELFPGIKPYKILCNIEDSNGNIRHIQTRRRLVVGTVYYYRLKQYAKEKAAVTSLSSTNMKGLNSKSRASKDFKSPYTNTATTFGNMELANLNHANPEVIVTTFMLHSASPHGRRLAKKLYENSDPFEININLDNEATNRTVEVFNAYLKCKGLMLQFFKISKTKFIMNNNTIEIMNKIKNTIVFEDDILEDERKNTIHFKDVDSRLDYL